MYLQRDTVIKKDGTVKHYYRLRESFRGENGQVKKKDIANVSHLSDVQLHNLEVLLAKKEKIKTIGKENDHLVHEQGTPVGATLLLHAIAKRVGITHALGNSEQGKRALWQIIARLIDQGSRLSATRLAASHAADAYIQMKPFNEESLYHNLHWISRHQNKIEDALYTYRKPHKNQTIYLYDVTSCYFEGTENAMAFFGYNRDKKKGKKQIVVGLLCDEEGMPLSIEVFDGNTKDTETVAAQIRKIQTRFGGGEIVFVGDRGMIKGPQIDSFEKETHYITAITKPQIRKLLTNGVIQMDMFDIELCEVCEGSTRYIMRKNPHRAKEIERTRESKYAALEEKVHAKNEYLKAHPRAHIECALRDLRAYAEKLKIHSWIHISESSGVISVEKDERVEEEERRLDGCYVLKSDVSKELATAETLHSRYKDLAHVEKSFRTMKQDFLELHPVFVRTEKSTRGHVFVVMLAYMIVRELKKLWKDIECTVQEGIRMLDGLCTVNVYMKKEYLYTCIPTPNTYNAQLFKAAGVKVPKKIPQLKSAVDPRKELSKRRK
jgi:transposase